MKELEQIDFDDVAGSRYTRRTAPHASRVQKLEKTLGGIRNLSSSSVGC